MEEAGGISSTSIRLAKQKPADEKQPLRKNLWIPSVRWGEQEAGHEGDADWVELDVVEVDLERHRTAPRPGATTG
jgi:hypothetical protein